MPCPCFGATHYALHLEVKYDDIDKGNYHAACSLSLGVNQIGMAYLNYRLLRNRSGLSVTFDRSYPVLATSDNTTEAHLTRPLSCPKVSYHSLRISRRAIGADTIFHIAPQVP